VPAALLRDRDTTQRGAGTGLKDMAAVLAAAVPDQPSEVAAWPTWRRLLPHVLAVVDRGSDDPSEEAADDITYLLDAAGTYLHWRGQSRAALPLWERVHQRRLSRDGIDHPETLEAARMWLKAWSGRVSTSRPAQWRRTPWPVNAASLARTTPLPSTRPTTSHKTCSGWVSTSRPEPLTRTPWPVNAGSLARTTVKPSLRPTTSPSDCSRWVTTNGPEPSTRTPWPASAGVLGEDHPSTLTSANNLALDLDRLGDYQQARTLGEDTLVRRRRVLGEDHTDTLGASARSLAEVSRKLGEAPE
jgi:hypothetical protein